jgi:hypothetical protein
MGQCKLRDKVREAANEYHKPLTQLSIGVLAKY